MLPLSKRMEFLCIIFEKDLPKFLYQSRMTEIIQRSSKTLKVYLQYTSTHPWQYSVLLLLIFTISMLNLFIANKVKNLPRRDLKLFILVRNKHLRCYKINNNT